jgi:hypothetical protein
MNIILFFFTDSISDWSTVLGTIVRQPEELTQAAVSSAIDLGFSILGAASKVSILTLMIIGLQSVFFGNDNVMTIAYSVMVM